MKKILIVLLTIALAATVFAQAREPSLTLSGEAKTGILWEEGQDAGKEKDLSKVRMHSKDDAGGSEGRFRLNMDYINANNFGFKVRIEWNNWTDSTPEKWSYAFGYGNFFDDQLTISAGKLGSSPWGTGGPEMWKELEVARSGGVRVEYKPNFIPEHLGTVNVGFVLNDFDDPNEASITREATFTDILMESVLGISYTHSLFHVRLAYRLDSERDSKQRMDGEKEGGKMIYRAEDRVLTNYLPGFQVWALGYLEGVGIGVHDMFYNFQNWFFAEYSPPLLGNLSTPFTAQIRFGYDYVESRQIFHIRPSFYWHFFDKLISAGASFWYGQDYGNKMFPGSPYFYMEFEPKVQLNLSSSYVAFVYSMRRQYKGDYAERGNSDPVRQTQFINLRFCIYF